MMRVALLAIAVLIAPVYRGTITDLRAQEVSGGDAASESGDKDEAHRSAPEQPASDELKDFVSRLLWSTEDTWHRAFKSAGQTYVEPKLVLYSMRTSTACGSGDAIKGPFYCPKDQKIYLDLEFFERLGKQFKAPGDFAQAYVIAHEVGHHIQNLLGIEDEARRIARSADSEARNAISVRVELQADCLAGVWAKLGQHLDHYRLEEGDLEEALNATTQVADDTLQQRRGGEIVPETFTHGSAAQRLKWFKTGYDSGQMQSCDSFRPEAP